jgi:hypothetical protein
VVGKCTILETLTQMLDEHAKEALAFEAARKGDPSKVNKVDDPLRAQRTREKRYAFDHVFGNGANNDDVHARTTQTIISRQDRVRARVCVCVSE